MVPAAAINGAFNLLSRTVEAVTLKNIAINEANSRLLAGVFKNGASGAVVLGCSYFIYKGEICN